MKQNINYIQELRGVGALLVVLVHAQMLVGVYEQRYGLSSAWLNSFESVRDFGQCGVDIFFVISGFVMAYITCRKHHAPGAVRDFLKRRIIRIVPLYWFYTSMLALLLFFVPQLFPPDALILFIAPCCCVGGYISYRVLEMPTLRFLSKVKLPARCAPAPLS